MTTGNKLLKTTNADLATQLMQSGFDCVVERNGKNVVYAFFDSPELETLLASKYKNTCFVRDSRLSF